MLHQFSFSFETKRTRIINSMSLFQGQKITLMSTLLSFFTPIFNLSRAHLIFFLCLAIPIQAGSFGFHLFTRGTFRNYNFFKILPKHILLFSYRLICTFLTNLVSFLCYGYRFSFSPCTSFLKRGISLLLLGPLPHQIR